MHEVSAKLCYLFQQKKKILNMASHKSNSKNSGRYCQTAMQPSLGDLYLSGCELLAVAKLPGSERLSVMDYDKSRI